MPTFENVPVQTAVDIDFEVYCGTCGAGLCNSSDTRRSRGRSYLQVSVNACPDCMESKDKEIKELKDRIDELESKLSELEN